MIAGKKGVKPGEEKKRDTTGLFGACTIHARKIRCQMR